MSHTTTDADEFERRLAQLEKLIKKTHEDEANTQPEKLGMDNDHSILGRNIFMHFSKGSPTMSVTQQEEFAALSKQPSIRKTLKELSERLDIPNDSKRIEGTLIDVNRAHDEESGGETVDSSDSTLSFPISTRSIDGLEHSIDSGKSVDTEVKQKRSKPDPDWIVVEVFEEAIKKAELNHEQTKLMEKYKVDGLAVYHIPLKTIHSYKRGRVDIIIDDGEIKLHELTIETFLRWWDVGSPQIGVEHAHGKKSFSGINNDHSMWKELDMILKVLAAFLHLGNHLYLISVVSRMQTRGPHVDAEVHGPVLKAVSLFLLFLYLPCLLCSTPATKWIPKTMRPLSTKTIQTITYLISVPCISLSFLTILLLGRKHAGRIIVRQLVIRYAADLLNVISVPLQPSISRFYNGHFRNGVDKFGSVQKSRRIEGPVCVSGIMKQSIYQSVQGGNSSLNYKIFLVAIAQAMLYYFILHELLKRIKHIDDFDLRGFYLAIPITYIFQRQSFKKDRSAFDFIWSCIFDEMDRKAMMDQRVQVFAKATKDTDSSLIGKEQIERHLPLIFNHQYTSSIGMKLWMLGRCFVDFIINFVIDKLLVQMLPFFLLGIDTDFDFVKDTLALQFIVQIDDLEEEEEVPEPLRTNLMRDVYQEEWNKEEEYRSLRTKRERR